jgi:hypothetical protein
MLRYEKIMQSIELSIAYLEASISALDKKDVDCFADSLWRSAEELEYALFLFSMKFQDESDMSKWKPKSGIKKGESGRLLEAAKQLLDESGKAMVDESWLDAYKSAYVARCYLLLLQEDLAKKRREAIKKK